MWKKTYIRSTLILLVAFIGIFVFATSHTTKKTAAPACLQSDKECLNGKSQPSEFLIWESLSRAIAANASF